MPRKSKKIKVRDSFLIITNGKETERNYFEIIRSLKSVYDVKIEFQNKDPKELILYGSRIKKEYNQVWCVFDVDSFQEEGKIKEAIKFAKRDGINIAVSNKSFEVWLLNHFKKTVTEINVHLLIDSLNKEMKKIDLDEYTKTDKKLLKTVFMPKLKIAVSNSKICYEKLLVENNLVETDIVNIILKCNPITTVYKLIEALRLQKT